MIEYNAIYMWCHADHPAIQVVPAQGLQPFLGNFMLMHFRCTTSEARHLIFGCYVVDECRDVMCDTCTGHVTFCYKRSTDASFEALLTLVSPFVRFASITHVRLVSNACRSQHIWRISRLESISFKHNHCVSFGQ